MVPNLAFLGKKRRNYWPRARAEINPDTAKKTCQIRVDTVSFLLCILLVPNALPKRERSLWLPPQNVLRQGWLGQILSRQLKPGFSQVKIYLKKNLNVWPDSLVLFLFFVSLTTLYFFLNVFLPFYVSATIKDIFVLFFEIVMPMLTFSFFLFSFQGSERLLQNCRGGHLHKCA